MEGRGCFGANFPNRVLLFDHSAQGEDRMSGEDPRRNLSSGHCWKVARKLGHPMGRRKVQVHGLSG